MNFLDVFLAMRVLEHGIMGEELCGRVLEVGADVSSVSVGDRVVALGMNCYGSEAIVREEMVALAPQDMSRRSPRHQCRRCSSPPRCPLTIAGLKSGERVLIHSGAGGVGLAAIQLAQAAGAEVFATASAPKQAYLRSLGVKHVFNSRQTSLRAGDT